jgi:hypothetical protein
MVIISNDRFGTGAFAARAASIAYGGGALDVLFVVVFLVARGVAHQL